MTNFILSAVTAVVYTVSWMKLICVREKTIALKGLNDLAHALKGLNDRE